MKIQNRGINMQQKLLLNQMSIADKLNTINQIWDSLVGQADDVPSPEWHTQVLSIRQQKVQNEEAQFHSLASVKQALKSQFK